MAASVACLRPSAPIMRMYIQLIGSTAALPSGAALTAPTLNVSLSSGVPQTPVDFGARAVTRQEGHEVGHHADRADARDHRRRAGMQKVLCKFRWLTSPPNSPGAATPTSAFMLAPST